MNDTLALLVGRAILAFGEIDQEIWNGIVTLTNIKRVRDNRVNGGWEPDQPLDPRFTHRLKILRQLLHEFAEFELRNFDRLRTRLDGDLERKRAHLAHGRIFEANGRYYVSDARESLEFNLALDVASDHFGRVLLRTGNVTLATRELDMPGKKHLNVSYSAEDLVGLQQEFQDVWQQLHRIIQTARVSALQRVPRLEP